MRRSTSPAATAPSLRTTGCSPRARGRRSTTVEAGGRPAARCAAAPAEAPVPAAASRAPGRAAPPGGPRRSGVESHRAMGQHQRVDIGQERGHRAARSGSRWWRREANPPVAAGREGPAGRAPALPANQGCRRARAGRPPSRPRTCRGRAATRQAQRPPRRRDRAGTARWHRPTERAPARAAGEAVPFAVKSRLTPSAESQRAPMPYTVSVGTPMTAPAARASRS